MTMDFTVSDVPGLPAGFTDTFQSHHVTVRDGDDTVRLHCVTGGSGPVLLLLPAWPQFWYGWRKTMPQLAQDFTVVALDFRGTGGSDVTESGYDPLTLAADTASVMQQLGHDRYFVAGYDLGMIVGYALAATRPEEVIALWAAESILPGISELPELLMPPELNEYLWHFPFNRLSSINEKMVEGREEIYFGYQFESKSHVHSAFPDEAVDTYVAALRRPGYVRAAFEFYRAQEMFEQIPALAKAGQLQIPVVAVNGEFGSGSLPVDALRQVAVDVTEETAPGVGHFLPEEAPDWTVASIERAFANRPSD